MDIDTVGNIILSASGDRKLHGQALCVTNTQGGKPVLFTMNQAKVTPYFGQEAMARRSPSASSSDASETNVLLPLPKTFKKVQVVKLSDKFRKATRVVTESLPATIPEDHVVVRRFFCEFLSATTAPSSGFS